MLETNGSNWCTKHFLPDDNHLGPIFLGTSSFVAKNVDLHYISSVLLCFSLKQKNTIVRYVNKCQKKRHKTLICVSKLWREEYHHGLHGFMNNIMIVLAHSYSNCILIFNKNKLLRFLSCIQFFLECVRAWSNARKNAKCRTTAPIFLSSLYFATLFAL